MNHQILIASYAPDFPWLYHNLRSLAKFSTGFLPPIIAVPGEDEAGAWELVDRAGSTALVKRFDGVGVGRAQHAMMSGDLLCPRADYYWLLGSDCLAVAPFTPEDFMEGGKPLMIYNTWEHMLEFVPESGFWRRGVSNALGWQPHGEFMRRLPLAYPTAMLPALREHIQRRHHEPFGEYVTRMVNYSRNFSESNVMGEWAFTKGPEHYTWWSADEGGPTHHASFVKSPIVQFWSHGSFDRPHDSLQKTPRQIITESLGSF